MYSHAVNLTLEAGAIASLLAFCRGQNAQIEPCSIVSGMSVGGLRPHPDQPEQYVGMVNDGYIYVGKFYGPSSVNLLHMDGTSETISPSNPLVSGCYIFTNAYCSGGTNRFSFVGYRFRDSEFNYDEEKQPWYSQL